MTEMNILLCELNQSLGLGFWIPVLISIGLAIWNLFQQLKIETLKKEIEKQLLVHRLQFEKEFNIYNELWSKLVDMRFVIAQLRPEGDTYDPEFGYEMTIKLRLVKATSVGNEIINMIEKNKPFYAKEVYEELIKITKIIRTEIFQTKHDDNRTSEYWEQGKKNIENLLELTDIVCETIRKRIGILEVK